MRKTHRHRSARRTAGAQTAAGSLATLDLTQTGPDTRGMLYVRHLASVVVLAAALSLGLAQQASASSADVAALQVALKAVGLYPVAVDGVKGPFLSLIHI